MEPMKEVSFTTRHGHRRIAVYAGDIAYYDEPIDVLVVSAYLRNYSPVPKTMIHALHKLGINVGGLSQSPEMDLKDVADIWLSRSVPKADLDVGRIACVELLHTTYGGDVRMLQEEILVKLRALFQMLDLASTVGFRVSTIALPILGTGNQGVSMDMVLTPMLSECQGFLQRNPLAERIVLVERNPSKAFKAATALGDSYALQRASAPALPASAAGEAPMAFISYATEDFDVVRSLAPKLEAKGITTWYAPRDIVSGDYASAIVNAITQCSHFIVIISQNSAKSEHVLNEVSLAFEELSRNVLLMPLRIDSEEMTPQFLYYLSRQQWAEANVPPLEQRLIEFADRVAKSAGV